MFRFKTQHPAPRHFEESSTLPRQARREIHLWLFITDQIHKRHGLPRSARNDALPTPSLRGVFDAAIHLCCFSEKGNQINSREPFKNHCGKARADFEGRSVAVYMSPSNWLQERGQNGFFNSFPPSERT
jgi:hypothetical protein